MKKVICALVIFVFVLHSEIQSCTGLYLKNDTLILAGNNEDWYDHDTKMWFVPGEEGTYGRVYFGFGNYWPQGGMNEKGLFFDGFATARCEVLKSEGKPFFDGNIIDHAMANCATVDEVVELCKKYNLSIFENAMLMFGDAHGNSVIVEGDDFVFIEGDYQICTNFYQSQTNDDDINCWRYLKAEEILSSQPDYSVELCKSILDAAHQKFTQYSNVYNLNTKIVYLYHFHDFERVVEIDLMEELKKGHKSYDIHTLFPEKEEFLESMEPKETPLNNKFFLYFLIFSALVFICTPVIPILIKRKSKGTLPDSKDVKFRLFRLMFISASIASLLLLIYLIALSQAPNVFNTGLPDNLNVLTTFQLVLIRIPLIVFFLSISMIVYLAISVFDRLWTLSLRLYYFTLIILLLINLGFLRYWNLVRL